MQNIRLLEVDGHTMAALVYNEHQQTRPIIFIHGLAGAIDFWEHVQITYVQRNCRWYSVSLPGHFPATLSTNLKYRDFNDDTTADMTFNAIHELVGDEPFVLVGISAGAYMALNVASKYPDTVHALACIDGFAAGDWIRRKSPVRTRLVFPLLVKLLHMFIMRNQRAYLRECYNNVGSVENARQNISDLDTLILKNFPSYQQLSARDLTYYARQLWKVDISHRLSNIACPTLLVHGDCDGIVPYAQGQQIFNFIPHAEFITLQGLGHVPMWENPPVFEDIFTPWLEKVL